MTDKASISIIHHFSTIVDPRVDRRKVHRLSDILFITLCTTICGADNWVADLADLSNENIIAIDGKCLRRSIDTASNKAAIYMVRLGPGRIV